MQNKTQDYDIRGLLRSWLIAENVHLFLSAHNDTFALELALIRHGVA